MRTVGKFTLHEDGRLSGPADYMRNGFDQEEIFKSAALMAQFAPASCDETSLFLIALQTDYAGWKGMQGM